MDDGGLQKGVDMEGGLQTSVPVSYTESAAATRPPPIDRALKPDMVCVLVASQVGRRYR